MKLGAACRARMGLETGAALIDGLAILVVLFRNRASINVEELDALKG